MSIDVVAARFGVPNNAVSQVKTRVDRLIAASRPSSPDGRPLCRLPAEVDRLRKSGGELLLYCQIGGRGSVHV